MDYQLIRLRTPDVAAHVIAEMLGGEALLLPPLHNCWVVLTEGGVELELFPDILNRRAADADPFAAGPAAVSVDSTETAGRIVTLALKAGWPQRQVTTADGARIEVAVEGRQILSIAAADETQAAEEMRRAPLRAAKDALHGL